MRLPHRRLIDAAHSYGEEGLAYLRRRRRERRPFARVGWGEGSIHSVGPDTREGRRLFLAAAELIDLARR